MADEDVLLEAVVKSPDDDAPRLAFADWCERQEDEAVRARAAFIRAQIAIARMDDADVEQGEWIQPLSLADQLRTRYGEIWAGRIREMVPVYGFGRGFVDYIRTGARSFLDRAAEYFALAPIQHLDLTGVREVTEELFSSPYLGRLRSLSMADCGLYDIHVQMLAASEGVANLRWLSLRDNHIGAEGIEAIPNSPHLKKLRYADFAWNPVDPGEVLVTEGGTINDSWLPEFGLDLERRFGHLEWLYHDGARKRFHI